MMRLECYFQLLLLLPFFFALGFHKLFGRFPGVQFFYAPFWFLPLLVLILIRACRLFESVLVFELQFLLLFLLHLLSDRDKTAQPIDRNFELLIKNNFIDIAILGFRNVLYNSWVVVQVWIGWQDRLSIPFFGLVFWRIRRNVIRIPSICFLLHYCLDRNRFFKQHFLILGAFWVKLPINWNFTFTDI